MPEANKITRICQQCGCEYHPRSVNRQLRFCGQQCHLAWRRETTTEKRYCETCGRPFSSPRYRPKRTCCPKCALELRRHRVTKLCESCGRQYRTEWARRKESRFCSKKCKDASCRKILRPSALQLTHLLLFFSYVKIAKIYDVSETLVRKWCEIENVTGPTIKERVWLKKLSNKDKRVLGEGRELETSLVPPGPMIQMSRPGLVHIPQLSLKQQNQDLSDGQKHETQKTIRSRLRDRNPPI